MLRNVWPFNRNLEGPCETVPSEETAELPALPMGHIG
jgi:hypothetical protein